MTNHLKAVFCVGALLVLDPQLVAADQGGPQPTVIDLLKTTTTAGGEPVALPSKDAEVWAGINVLPPHFQSPVHKHDYVRIGYVMEGTLTQKYADGSSREYKKGSVVIDPIGSFHQGINSTDKPVRLYLVEVREKNRPNTVTKQIK